METRDAPDGPVDLVLDCANRVAGTALHLPPGGDLPLEAFEFDSLSAFAFVLELERLCGLAFDERLLNLEELHSIRSVAALVVRSGAHPDTTPQDPGPVAGHG
jgi:hypothetical protein